MSGPLRIDRPPMAVVVEGETIAQIAQQTPFEGAQQRLQHLFAYDRSDPLFASQLTMPQLKILLLLYRLGDTSGRELAGLMGVSLATMSGMVETGGKGPRQPLMIRKAHHLVHAVRLGDGGGAVGAAVVDDDDLDLVDATDLPRQRREGLGKGFLLVQTGDLDHQFHGRLKRG